MCDLVVDIKSTEWQEKSLSIELQFIDFSINVILSIILGNVQKLDRLCVSFSLTVCLYVEYGRKNGQVFTSFREVAKSISFVMSVLPHGTTQLPMDVFSWNLIWRFFESMSRKFKFYFNLTRLTDTFHEYLSTFIIISLWILLRIKNISDKFVEKIKTYSLG
jgi:hypothetical protein